MENLKQSNVVEGLSSQTIALLEINWWTVHQIITERAGERLGAGVKQGKLTSLLHLRIKFQNI